MSLVTKIFGTYSENQIKKITPLVNKTEELADKYSKMTDGELSALTPKFKERLSRGETLNDILPEAFAAVREAATRAIGKRPFRVQIIGGILLHQGRIAEMKTGEGKTLVATMPAYLNALTGNGVHIVTVNDYLARRDSEEMGRVYGFLGLTTGLIVHDQSTEEKKAAYACDITYGTNNEIGFDYLRDNLAGDKAEIVMRELNFAVVDEVDSILIDEARTPLIISGSGGKPDEMYGKADRFVRGLQKKVVKELEAENSLDLIKMRTISDREAEDDHIDADYIVDEKKRSATLTSRGIKKAEMFFGIDNLSDTQNNETYHYISEALQAHGIMKRDVDYVVSGPDVLIVDAFTGRIMPGRRFSNGLHQAIEAKEKVKIQKENQTIATITFQNLFRLYKKLSGMTGTALTEESEFREIYGLDVVEVPTNEPMIRKDYDDLVYKNEAGKYRAIINQIRECHAKGQPVLVGTVSVEKSETLSKLLKKEGIQHSVLNAKQHAKEAEIIAQAGKLGAVTISTNMAGRGTDIMLGGNAEFLAKGDLKKEGYSEEEISLAVGMSENIDERVRAARELYHASLEKHKDEIAPEAEKVRSKEVGGLFILGTERHESRRIDNQLRGRSGRQGDPGESRFFLSLEDDLLRLFGSDRVSGLVERLGLPEDEPIEAGIISSTIESAQKRIEGRNFAARKNVLDFDDVMNTQRELIYNERRAVLDGKDISGNVEQMLDEFASNALDACVVDGKISAKELDERLFWILSPSERGAEKIRRDELEKLLDERVHRIYSEKETLFGEDFSQVRRHGLLRSVDSAWMEHLDAMDNLRDGIGLSSYGQKNPLTEYKIASISMFEEMIEKIREDTIKYILCAIPVSEMKKRMQEAARRAELKKVGGDGEKQKPVTKSKSDKIGRNDPCPCGSGKKYKNCCGKNVGSIE